MRENKHRLPGQGGRRPPPHWRGFGCQELTCRDSQRVQVPSTMHEIACTGRWWRKVPGERGGGCLAKMRCWVGPLLSSGKIWEEVQLILGHRALRLLAHVCAKHGQFEKIPLSTCHLFCLHFQCPICGDAALSFVQRESSHTVTE